jgi:CTP synthase
MDASLLEETEHPKHTIAWSSVRTANGILVPGGFSARGTEGMILAAHYAHTSKTPFLGICLGFQVAVIEFARSVGMLDANSIELHPETAHPVVVCMPEIDKTKLGGTMRLGSRATHFQQGSEWSKVWALCGKEVIYGRHRYRYEVNPDYVEELSTKELEFIGKD